MALMPSILYVDGWDGWMDGWMDGWVGMVNIGPRSSKSTFGANNRISSGGNMCP